jgi:hypothetical protein
MSILLTVLIVTSVWVFLAVVLGGCGRADGRARRERDNVFVGEVWPWERRGRGDGRRAAGPTGTTRPERTALPSSTA